MLTTHSWFENRLHGRCGPRRFVLDPAQAHQEQLQPETGSQAQPEPNSEDQEAHQSSQ